MKGRRLVSGGVVGREVVKMKADGEALQRSLAQWAKDYAPKME